MKVAILDDWHDTLRHLPCFSRLAGHDVAVWTDHVEDEDVLAERLAGIEALVLIRERTRITGSLLDRRPALKLISQRSVYPHVDVPGCTRNGVLLCSNMHADTPSYAAAELTWALVLAAARRLPDQVASLKAGHVDRERRTYAARQDARHLWLGPDRRGGCRIRAGVRHGRARLGAG
jgi:D-3-phosphoglycerate dehydrogenase